MELILYIIIFIIGTVFGSFSTLAIYRIPQKKNITTERSFCPNCKHKLNFIDLIPVWSYILLGGKCRYCNKKISSSYFFIETLMGIASLGIFFSIMPSIQMLSVLTLTEYLYLMIFATTLVIIAGIDRNKKQINKPKDYVYQYTIYLYIINNINIISIYKYVIYFFIVVVLSIITTRHKLYKYKYLLEILMICIYMNMFIVSEIFLITAVLTMISLTGSVIVRKRKLKIDQSDILAEKDINLDIPIAFYLCISNIIAMIIQAIPII